MNKKEKYPIKRKRKFEYTKEEKKTAKVGELKNFIKYYGKFKGLLCIVAVLLLLSSALSLISPILTGNLIALFSENFVAKDVIDLSLIILALSLVSCVLNYFINRLWVLMGTNSVYFLTSDLVHRLNIITQGSFDSADSGVFTTRMYGDIDIVSRAPLNLMDYFCEALTQVGFLSYTFSLNPWIGLFMLAYTVILIALEYSRINMRQRNRKIIRNVAEKESSFRYENIKGMKDIRGINATDNVITKSLDLTCDKLEYEYTSSIKMNMLNRVRDAVKAFLSFAFIALCVYLLVTGEIVLAAFLIAYNYRGQIQGFANYIISIKSYMSDLTLSAQRLNEIFDTNKYPIEKYGNVELVEAKGLLEFKNVTFGYNDEKNILNDLSLEIKPNQITSLVGLSGAGKSTIVSLINRLYDVDENKGEILLDGVNIQDLTRDSLRSNICNISQSPYIYNMTIGENLKLAKPDATEEEMREALKKANILDYVEDLPEKLDSKLGENGIKLSGGQKQRLAIARAILRNSQVILFDEATSALDNKNQAIVKRTIKKLAKDHTVLMIAHRLSTVVDSDNIIFLKDGNVHAQGKHDYLMENCPEYHDLYIEEDLSEETTK